MRIGLDVMGGDFAPESIIEGAIDSLQHLSVNEKIILIGNESSILRKLNEMQIDPSLFEIVHTSQVIEMGDHPAKAFSQKKDSSICSGIRNAEERESGRVLQCRKYRCNACWSKLYSKCDPWCIKTSTGYCPALY